MSLHLQPMLSGSKQGIQHPSGEVRNQPLICLSCIHTDTFSVLFLQASVCNRATFSRPDTFHPNEPRDKQTIVWGNTERKPDDSQGLEFWCDLMLNLLFQFSKCNYMASEKLSMCTDISSEQTLYTSQTSAEHHPGKAKWIWVLSSIR